MIVLDTHALVWWVNDSADLSETARKLINQELSSKNGVILISAISAWEIALLVQKERLKLTMPVDDWIEAVESIQQVRFVSVDPSLAIESTRLPGTFHADPADRMIVATARHLNLPLLTADGKIQAYTHVHTIW